MKWLASAACLLPLIICRAEPPKNSAWQVEAKPVLVPGDVGSWDDFALRDLAVLRVENKWLMIYNGIALSEDGRTCGLGLASSSDGVTWQKPLDEAIVPVDPNTDVLSPALVRWNGAYLAAYVVQPLRDSADDTEPDPRVEFASSEGGRVWQPQTNAGFAIKIPDSIYLRIGFYADGGMLHLWWLGSDADRKAVLCHSISRDGLTWSHPNMQPADKIDSRDMVGARVYPSGNFFLLVYLARVSVNVVSLNGSLSSGRRSPSASAPAL